MVHIQTTDSDERAMTSSWSVPVRYLAPFLNIGRGHTMVTAIVQSSNPNSPPQHFILAIIRRRNATKAITPPTTPAMDTTFVWSRTG
ncbi:unnamed protein product [Aspergillus oryzae]|uniref:Unnamed protein product n=2 Tax=Aspergillus oryzae TaxID=5062 RepID=A0AAN5C1B9_ASPOZ|nr:unnamed protein product [Aspergillus oryzae]GMF93881.1 unnamed protein product [Aspergillus oryzae]GMG13793.1 unnamed protein product [Aspergillus oryzae]GMG33859.1 unnamed protein product [Aspergillus oryzae]GMG50062.1 unnamed protein product [Aspergillus oryzae var. brunneus]